MSYGPFGGYRPQNRQQPEGYPYRYNDVYFPTELGRNRYAARLTLLRNAQRAGFPRTDEGVKAYLRQAQENREDRAFNAYQWRIKRDVLRRLRVEFSLKQSGPVPKALESVYQDRIRRLMAHRPFTGPLR